MSQDWENEEDDQQFWPTPQPGTGTKAPPGNAKASPPRKTAMPPAFVKPLTLLELCEPVFLYLCRLNRSARAVAARFSAAQVRDDLKKLLANAKSLAKSQRNLAGQWEQTEIVLIFITDFLIRNSDLPFAQNWEDLAYELRREMAGDERFFDLLDQTLADKSPDATERLAVFYTGIGLGFTGLFMGQPEILRKKMLECSSRIRHLIDSDPTLKVCPDAYENVNTTNLIESPRESVVGIAIALVGLIIVLLAANFVAYRSSADTLNQSIGAIPAKVQNKDYFELPTLPRYKEPSTNPTTGLSPTTSATPETAGASISDKD